MHIIRRRAKSGCKKPGCTQICKQGVKFFNNIIGTRRIRNRSRRSNRSRRTGCTDFTLYALSTCGACCALRTRSACGSGCALNTGGPLCAYRTLGTGCTCSSRGTRRTDRSACGSGRARRPCRAGNALAAARRRFAGGHIHFTVTKRIYIRSSVISHIFYPPYHHIRYIKYLNHYIRGGNHRLPAFCSKYFLL